MSPSFSYDEGIMDLRGTDERDGADRIFEGRVLEGRWRIAEKIGAGGMGTVYRAVDVMSGRSVAVKTFSWGGDPKSRSARRFHREYAVGRELEHPNVVPIHAFGTLGATGAYLVMDHLPHPTLEAELRSRGRIPVELCRTWLDQMALALDFIHGRGVIHRDLKPANLMVSAEGRVVVMDFGIIRDLDGTRLTETGQVMGTPLYTAPEILRGAGADARSDIFQLGVIAYEMLSGSNPFAGDNVGRIFTRILTEEPRPLHGRVPDLDPAWDRLIAACLTKDPEGRLPSARVFRQELAAIGTGRGEGGVAPRPSPEEGDGRSDATEILSRPSESPREASRRLRYGSSLLLFIVASILLLWIGFPRRAPRSLSPRPSSAPPIETSSSVDGSETALDLRVEALSEGRLRIVWKGEEGVPWSLRVHEGLRPSRSQDGKPGGDRSWAAVLEPPLSHVTEITLHGADVSRSLATLLRRRSDHLCEGLSAFVARDMAYEICRRMTRPLDDTLRLFEFQARNPGKDAGIGIEELARRRREGLALEKMMLDHLRAGSFISLHRQAAALTPLLFRTRILPLERRLVLFHLFMRFERLRLLGSFYQVELLDLPPPDFGDFAYGMHAMAGDCREIVVWESERGAMRIGAHLPFQANDGRRPEWRSRFDLPSGDWERAELAFDVESFLDCSLRVTVNDRLVSHVYDRPRLPEHDHRVTTYHRLPVDLLRSGPNWLELAFDGLFNHISHRAIRVHRIALRLLPREGGAAGGRDI